MATWRCLSGMAIVCPWLILVAAAADSPAPIRTFSSRDSLSPQADESADARACLDNLIWKPGDFEVTLEPASDSERTACARAAAIMRAVPRRRPSRRGR